MPMGSESAGVEVSFKSRGKTDWLGIAKVLAAIAGMTGGGFSVYVATRPTVAIADGSQVTAITKGVADAQAAATSAQATAWDAKTVAEQSRRDVEALTRAIERTNDKLDAQAAQLNQIIGQLRGLGK